MGKGFSSEDHISFCNRKLVRDKNGEHRLSCRDNFNALERVKTVKITILKTERNSVPCMTDLKIFGKSTHLEEFSLQEQTLMKKFNDSSVKCVWPTIGIP